jgi:septal ring factor EnvC (AmiA/AmiB activator)
VSELYRIAPHITDILTRSRYRLNELVPRKRVQLSSKLSPSSSAAATLFSYFLRLPDILVTNAHFRPEALRKVRATREEEVRKIRKLDDEEKAEERKLAADKLKKEERERKLSKMSAEEQRRFLEKEKEKNQRKGMKKQTMRG